MQASIEIRSVASIIVGKFYKKISAFHYADAANPEYCRFPLRIFLREGVISRTGLNLLENFRHAAVVVLVGWYLMLPAQPVERGTANASPSPEAASTFAVYKTQRECEEERRALLDDPVVGEGMADAKCLNADDDPHLKSN